ncbi:MAG: hypothetical protein GWP63_15180 [Haliea sp.]|jgi:hypothetical protein|nr:hypothetical protein [Haliea sp.]
MLSVQSKRLRYHCLPWLAGTILSTGTLADEPVDVRELPGKTLPNYTQGIDSGSFESIKYGKGLKVKGWRFSEGVYFGGVKVDGEYGPGVVLDKGSYVWGFNHERIQFRLRF